MNVLVYKNIAERHILKANIINTVNITKGFIQNGCNVSFYVPDKLLYFFKDLLPGVNFIHNLSNIDKFQVIYFRDIESPFTIIKKNKYKGFIIVESHDINISTEEINILKSYDKFIFTSIAPSITDKYQFTKSLLFPCSIDYDVFSNKNKYNSKLFSSKSYNITYCGHLYDYKGIPLIIEAAKILKEYQFHIVGGKDDDIQRHKEKSPKNIIFYGHKNYNEVPNYLYSSDILLIPYSKQGNKWSPSTVTAPIKLFEYLSTKIPVLCSDITGIKNWVNDDEVTFFKADNITHFVEMIHFIKNHRNTEEMEKKLENGLNKASFYSTKNKCKELLKLCK